MIIGGSGSGKSTTARQLGKRTGLPVVHLDALNWSPGWVLRDDEDRFNDARKASENERWIIEGNYSATFADRIRRADTIVFLDICTVTRILRVLKRMVKYQGTTRPDPAPGCPEKIDFTFLPWVWSYSRRGARRRALEILHQNKGRKNTVHLTSRKTIAGFLETAKFS